MGRRVEQVPENYSLDNFRAWTDRSRRNLGVDTLDLVQLHCPPSATVDADATYDALDTLVADGAIAAYGLSVETADQALSAIARPHVASIQIILNAFRLKPLDAVLPAAAEAGVGIIVRVPLASGLLSGKYDESTTFAADDHRTYNRDGSAFDVGETFSGVDFESGVRAAREFSALVDDLGPTPAEVALAWAGQQPGVTTVIPGARNAGQARANAAAGEAARCRRRCLTAYPDLRPALPRGRARPLVARQASSLRSRACRWKRRCRRRRSLRLAVRSTPRLASISAGRVEAHAVDGVRLRYRTSGAYRGARGSIEVPMTTRPVYLPKSTWCTGCRPLRRRPPRPRGRRRADHDRAQAGGHHHSPLGPAKWTPPEVFGPGSSRRWARPAASWTRRSCSAGSRS